MSHTKISRSRERHPTGPQALDKRDAFFTNLLLLGFDKGEMESQFNVPFSRDMFSLPNKKCFEVVMHFLFERLNPVMAQDRFRYCWPITDKKQEQNFRKVVNGWFTEIKEEEDSFLPRIVPSLFLSPGGDKFYNLLLHFSRYVVHKVILNDNGVKERELLLYPQSASKDQELIGQVGRALQASSVRHRKSFLTHLQTDLMLQERWTTYSSELVSEYRRLTKELRDLEQRIKQEEAHLLEQASSRGSPSATKRRRSGALLDAEWDTMAVRRTQKVQKVREMWKTVESCHSAQHQEREVVESILQRTANQYRVDGAELNVQVPEMLLRECHKDIEKQNISNTYEGGKLNLLSLIQLWNLSLRLYLEKIHQAPPADFESLHSEVVTQVHTHHAHLTNLQSLRSSMSQEVLPAIKTSIHSLKRQLELGYEAPTRDSIRRHNRSSFLDDGLGLMPATPPVSFEPASQAQARDDTPTRPINKAFLKPSPTTDTPEAVSSLLQNVNRAVARQGSLAQGTPTSTLKLLRDQINRPSRLPKPVPAEAGESYQLDRRRIKSAPAQTGSYYGHEETQTEDDSTLKLEDAGNLSKFATSSSVKRGKQNVGTHHKKTSKESRIGTSLHQTASVRPTPKTSVRKSQKKTFSSKKSSTPAPPPRFTETPPNKPRLDQTSSSVTRAHQVLIDQIADAVVGAMSGSPDFKGLTEHSPSALLGRSPSPLPMGIEDPLSVLDQSAFVTRDKLQHSPSTTPAHHTMPSTLAKHAKASPLAAHVVRESVRESPLQRSIVTENVRGDSHGGSDLLQGMEDEIPQEHEVPVGSLLDLGLGPTSPLDQDVGHRGRHSTSMSLTERLSLTPESPRDHRIHTGTQLEDFQLSGNINNSRLLTPTGPSPFRLSSDSFNSSPLTLPDADLSVERGSGGLLSGLTPEAEPSPLGLVELDQQLADIFGTRTPQLPSRMKGRASSASPGSGDNGSSSSLNVDDAVGRLDFGSSPISEQRPNFLELDAFDMDDRNVVNGETGDYDQGNGVPPTGIMSSRKTVPSTKQRGSEGSQKSVTFSDHVDERNISAHSLSSDLNGSLSNRDVFTSDGLVSSPAVKHKTVTQLYSPLPQTKRMSSISSSPSGGVNGVGDVYLSPSTRPRQSNTSLEVSPLDDILSLDDTGGNGHDDFLLDNSTRLEDLLVHVSPAVTPSNTPTIPRFRGAGDDYLPDTSFGSAPKSMSKLSFQMSPDDGHRFSLPANISGLSFGSPSSAHDASLLRDLSNLRIRTPGKTTPKYKASPLSLSHGIQSSPISAVDFDLLDEDESVLLPPSPYAQSPSTQSPAGAVGQLIDI